MTGGNRLGVVIVSFHSADFIAECLQSLFASGGVDLRVVVVDNNSTDTSCQVVRDWASGALPYRHPAKSPLAVAPQVAKPVDFAEGTTEVLPQCAAPLTLLRTPVNGGFAYAVNHGLRFLLADPEIDLFWLLNPDCVVPPQTGAAIRSAADEQQQPFAMIGGRILYYEQPDIVQTDGGGMVSTRTGRCISFNTGLSAVSALSEAANSLDYVAGANLIASRFFVDHVGLLAEDYFIFYEEVDWAFRRKSLPMVMAPNIIVYHHGGATTGSGGTARRPTAFANYFNYRNRIRFVRRFMPRLLIPALCYSVAKAGQLITAGAFDEAVAILRGSFQLAPPQAVRNRIPDPAARRFAFEDYS